MDDLGVAESNKSFEMIAFQVGKQEFGCEVSSVVEIRGWTPATPIPHAPGFVRGVINLRGKVLPIVDLAMRLGLPTPEPTARHVIIVVELHKQSVGLLVDGVSDIFTTNRAKIQPTPNVASELAQMYVQGVIAEEGKLRSVLAVQDLVPPIELAPVVSP